MSHVNSYLFINLAMSQSMMALTLNNFWQEQRARRADVVGGLGEYVVCIFSLLDACTCVYISIYVIYMLYTYIAHLESRVTSPTLGVLYVYDL